MEKVGSKVLHSVNRVAALALLFVSGQNLAQGWGEKENAEVSIGLELGILRVNIILQIVELVLVASGKIKGNTRRHILLLLDRSFLAFFFLSPESDRMLFLCLAFLYSTADTLRYWTLIFSKGSYLPLLRYMFPLLAGLLLPYLSLTLSNNYIKVNAEEIEYSLVNWIRVGQLGLIVHGFLAYKAYLTELGEFEENKEKKEKV